VREAEYTVPRAVLSRAALARRVQVGAAGEGGAPCSTLHDGSVGMRTLHVANAGDARAVLCKDITGDTLLVERLSFDHKPGNPDERKRIEQVGRDLCCSRLSHVDRAPVVGVCVHTSTLELSPYCSHRTRTRTPRVELTRGEG
jgi:hypothetical protein